MKKLIEMIDESTVDSIEISSDKGMKIRISKSPQQRGGVQWRRRWRCPMVGRRAAPPAAAPTPRRARTAWPPRRGSEAKREASSK